MRDSNYRKRIEGEIQVLFFKTFVSSKYNVYANLILMDFLNGEINNLNQEKKKFCFLIYFLFWFKLFDMAFYKKIKMLTWHIKMSNNIFNRRINATLANRVFRLPPKTLPLGH